MAFALRLWGIAWGLRDANVSVRPHPDEWTVYWLLQWFQRYGSPSPCPNPGRQCFFDWGMAFPYLAWAARSVLSPALGVLHAADWGRLADMAFIRTVLAARLLSAAVSTATVYVVYRIGLRAYGTVAGLAGAAVAAIATLLVQLGHFGTPDTTTGLLLSLTLLAGLTAMERPSIGRFAVAGAAAGLAFGSEYHMALLGVPLLVAWLLASPRRWRYLPPAALAAIVAFLALNPYAVVEFPSWLAAMEHTLRIRTVDSAAQYGTRWNAYGPAWLYVGRYVLGYGVGLPLALWMVGGAAWAVWRRERSDLVLLAWLVPYFLLVTLSPAKFMRYSAPLLPVLAVFAGRAFADLLGSRRSWTRVAAMGMAALTVAYTLVYDAAYDGLLARPDTRYAAANWLARNAPAGARVAYEQLPNGLINLPYFGTQRGFRPCIAQFEPAQLEGPQRYLVTDSYDLEEHPRFADAAVRRFRRALAANRRYRRVATFRAVPGALGIAFPIDASPHDWRYPEHVVTIYRVSGRGTLPAQRANCFATLAGATAVLYPASGP